jgi:hypothetical protein
MIYFKRFTEIANAMNTIAIVVDRKISVLPAVGSAITLQTDGIFSLDHPKESGKKHKVVCVIMANPTEDERLFVELHELFSCGSGQMGCTIRAG